MTRASASRAGQQPAGVPLSRTVPATLAALVVFSVVVCLIYGRRGYMPLDHSITFDGGWRLLCGQVPYRDFTTPSGLVPILIQALLFKLFGVTWLVYCAHAAAFNALFALLVYGLLRRAGGGVAIGAVLAATSAAIFYPAVGVPFHEHHSFVFGLLAIYLVAGDDRTARGRLFRWAGAGLAMCLALLSKQVPAVFVLPVVLLIGLLEARGERVRSLIAFGGGVAATFGAAATCGLALGIDWALAAHALLELPGSTGAGRLERLVPGRQFLEGARLSGAIAVVAYGLALAAMARLRAWSLGAGPRVLATMAAWSAALGCLALAVLLLLGTLSGSLRPAAPFAALGIASWALALGLALLPRPGWSAGERIARGLAGRTPTLLLAAGMLATCLLFIAVTNNQPAMGMAYVFAALGLTAIAWSEAVAGAAVESGHGSDGAIRRRAIRAAVVAAALLVAAADTYRFHGTYNVTRRLNDFRKAPETEDGALIAPEMAFLRLALPEATRDPSYGRFRARHYADVIRFFEKRHGGFFLIGDSSILYALTGRPSTNPVLWFHFGLTLPAPGTVGWERYETRLLDNLRRHDGRFVVLERKGTWMGTHIVHFPRLRALIDESSRDFHEFGPFQILPLDRSRLASARGQRSGLDGG